MAPVNHQYSEIHKILWTEQEIASRVEALAMQISADYEKKFSEGTQPLLVLGILKGSIIFLSDLIRELSLPLELDFVRIASYGTRTDPGVISFIHDSETDVRDRHVLIVEDIVDSGQTIEFLLNTLSERGATSVETCTLIDKTSRRECDLQIKYIGFELTEDEFVVGYGLDYAEKYRELPYIATLDPNSIK